MFKSKCFALFDLVLGGKLRDDKSYKKRKTFGVLIKSNLFNLKILFRRGSGMEIARLNQDQSLMCVILTG